MICQLCTSESISSYLGHDLDTIAHFVKCLAKSHIVVSCIHLYKAEQRLLDSPLSRCGFFNPMGSDSEIGIGIARLPCIACQADFADHSGTLARMSADRKIKAKKKTDVEAVTQ